MKSFIKKLLGRFVKVSIIKAAEEATDSAITSVDYVNVENQLKSEIVSA